MADFAQKNSKTWRRASRLVIDNELYQPPQITYSVEEVTEVSGAVISRVPIQGFSTGVDLDELVVLRNPATGELLGASMSKAEIMVAMFSCGWHDMEKAGIN